MTLDSPDLQGTTANVDRFDDPVGGSSTCIGSPNDCHAYDPLTGKGTFTWRWVGTLLHALGGDDGWHTSGPLVVLLRFGR